MAERLNCTLYDGDDFHTPENLAKMANGIPLDDQDRDPWLMRLHDLIHAHLARGETAIITCSALKKATETSCDSEMKASSLSTCRLTSTWLCSGCGSARTTS